METALRAHTALEIRFHLITPMKYRELAESDEYETRRRRWRDVLGLRKPDRAPVWMREMVSPSNSDTDRMVIFGRRLAIGCTTVSVAMIS